MQQTIKSKQTSNWYNRDKKIKPPKSGKKYKMSSLAFLLLIYVWIAYKCDLSTIVETTKIDLI